MTSLSSAPSVVRCTTTAQFLSALPFLTGYTDEQSLFLVLFDGKRSEGSLRLDLPDAEDAQQLELFLDAVVSLLRETGAGPGAPALVITTTESFGASGEIPWAKLCRGLRRRFRAERWQMREFAIIAADGWCPMLGTSSGRKRPLHEIQGSDFAAHLSTLAPAPRTLRALGQLPPFDADRAAAVLEQLTELEQRRVARNNSSTAARPPAHLLWMRAAARIIDSCMRATEQGGRVTARQLAKLIDSLQTPDRWMASALTTLTRAEFVAGLAEECAHLRLTDLPVAAPADAQGAGANWSISRLLLSLSFETPEAHKLNLAAPLLADAAAHAPASHRPAVLALLAWLWWMLGMQSVAHRFITQAAELDAAHELVRMVDLLNESPPAYRLLDLKERFSEPLAA